MRSQLKRTNYFVNTVIGLGIVGKLVGDSMAVLEVTGVAQRKNQARPGISFFHGRDGCFHTIY